jgi:hypothetical protein
MNTIQHLLQPATAGQTASPRSTVGAWLRQASWALSLGLGLLATAQAAGTVNVRWVDPAGFSDVSRSPIDRDRELQALADFMGTLGKHLPNGQVLSIEVVDLNLAGEVNPFSWREARVLRGGADWPQMELRYTLSSEGRALKSGQAQLSDMNYLFTQRRDELGYEKRMIERWFRTEFPAH